ncbi:MAG: TetR/AcrR family transcriptional regulator [Porticoccaceae bacterium]|jgi:AcrR family transcriptional regulator|nr:TetR/AcrR family transcriptional regulator [Porticoccaceae bacterium]|tara:strand:- start:5615 stop:6223 length:609 start_codon:yes stop_codon:yes gene_type:complete
MGSAELQSDTTPPDTKLDGRLLRSERSRQLIIAAMIELVGEGNLIPTAQQVAERADVGIRSVFRHFDDMDSIFETTNAIMLEVTKPLFVGGDRSGTIEVRILHATEQLTNGYASAKNFLLSGKIRMWNTPVVKKNYILSQRRIQKELEDWIPEILSLPELDKQSAYALASFDYWLQLREVQNASNKDCVEIISNQISYLFPK